VNGTVLLTGAGGFLGAAVFKRLVAEGVSIAGTFRSNRTRLPAGDGAGTRLVQIDLTDGAAVKRLFDEVRPAIVIHTAAAVGSENSLGFLSRALADNVTAHANLAAAVESSGCERIVSCSSFSVYGEGAGFSERDPAEPRSIYGWSKLQGERILDFTVAAAPALTALSLRLAGIHGPGRTTGVIATMVGQAVAGRELKIAEPESRFQFLFVDDAAEALWLAASRPVAPGHHRYNVAGRDAVRLPALAERILALTGAQSGIEHAEGAAPRDRTMDTTAFRSDFGFAPAPLDQRLAELVADLRTGDAA